MRPRLLAILIGFVLAGAPTACGQEPVKPIQAIDDAQAQANGIRKVAGKHLTLYTDVPSSPEVDRLPSIFDAAVPQWAAAFGVDEAKISHWQARAFLISDRRRFEALGLMPPRNVEFVNGISMGAEMWLMDQPTEYYRRHLMLHEGTHVFMASFLGGCGPAWYMEGIAELFATHRLDEKTGQLTLRIMPKSREEVPMLGRIKLIRDAVIDQKTLSFDAVMKLDGREQLGNLAYAWCWAAAKFLDTHPRYRDRFRVLYKNVLDPNFDDVVRHTYEKEWPDIAAEWQAYIATLDHGYDFDRMAIDFSPGAAGSATLPREVIITSDRGWQPAGVRLEAGKSYKITAAGRYQIAVEQSAGGSQAWPCEPGGVTIVYNDGHPLGMLLGAVEPGGETAPNAAASFAHPAAIGLQAVLKPAKSGTLYLRVNDSPAKLDDNRGTLTVKIEE